MTNTRDALKVYADRRWPLLSGIGTYQQEIESRCPTDIELIDLDVKGEIGSPLSPWRIGNALSRKAGDGPGVFYSAGFMPSFPPRGPSVIVVHDLMHREFYGRLKRFYYDWILRYLYRRCSAICCVSDFSRAEFLAWSGVNSERVHVVHSICSTDFTLEGEKYEPGYDYIAYAGNHRGYKNIDRLIRAYALSRLPADGIRLLITGKHNEELAVTAREVGVSEQVIFTGFLPAGDIPKLYRGAKAIAYVSLLEGFGLPILEAFQSGVPIVTSNVSSMPEVAGDAAVLVDPYSAEAIADGLNRVIYDEQLREDLIAKGLVRAKFFSGDQSAEKLWGIVRAVGKGIRIAAPRS